MGLPFYWYTLDMLGGGLWMLLYTIIFTPLSWAKWFWFLTSWMFRCGKDQSFLLYLYMMIHPEITFISDIKRKFDMRFGDYLYLFYKMLADCVVILAIRTILHPWPKKDFCIWYYYIMQDSSLCHWHQLLNWNVWSVNLTCDVIWMLKMKFWLELDYFSFTFLVHVWCIIELLTMAHWLHKDTARYRAHFTRSITIFCLQIRHKSLGVESGERGRIGNWESNRHSWIPPSTHVKRSCHFEHRLLDRSITILLYWTQFNL